MKTQKNCQAVRVAPEFIFPLHAFFDASFLGWLEVTARTRPEKALEKSLEAVPASVAICQRILAETANTKELNRRLSISLAKDRLSFF